MLNAVNNKKIYRRLSAGMSKLLIAATVVNTVFTVPVFAAAPEVEIDETLYGNLDFYGNLEDLNVVKGCSLNGNTEFTDYGQYTAIENMSDSTVPEKNRDFIVWKGLDPSKRFYYQGTLDHNAVQLPWKIDISYKLNGVPKKAQELAGAAGTVEIDIKATPNENTTEYMKNNMMLTVGMPIDMDKCLSVDAPGSQIQVIGGMSGVVFTALPGEEGDFAIRIGTDSFETTGVIAMIMPGTVDSLKKIKDLKEAKDIIKDSYDAVYASMDELMGVISSMNSGLTSMKDGLVEIQKAQNTFSNTTGEIQMNSDATVAGLRDLTEKSAAMVPHLKDAQVSLRDLQDDFTDIVNICNDTKPIINDTIAVLGYLQSDLADLEDSVADGSTDLENSHTIIDDVNVNLGKTEAALGQLQQIIANQKNPDMNASIEKVNAAIKDLASNSNATEAYYEAVKVGAVASKDFNDAMSAAMGIGSQMISSTKKTSSSISSSLDNLVKGLDTSGTVLDDSYALAECVADSLKQVNQLIDAFNGLNTTMLDCTDKSVAALKSAEDLTQSVTNSLNDTTNLLSTLSNLFRNTSGNLNKGAKKSIEGSLDLIDKSLSSIGITDTIKNANTVIKNEVDKQNDKFENENNFLEMDPEADKISFTSDQNKSPRSIQIVLRSDEISIDDAVENNTDLEAETDNMSSIGRMINVFKQIFKYIINIFKNL